MSVSSIGAYTGVSPFTLGGFMQGQTRTVQPATLVTDSSEEVRRSVRDTAQMIVGKLAGQAQVGENGGQNGEALTDSLAATADWMNEKYGAKAGEAVLGILAGYVGNGNVGEEALSKGMLAAIRFTDRNFGISAGDALADRLNAGLNVQVNDYFDNGLSEQIYTSTIPANEVSRTLSMATQGIAERFGPGEAATAQNMLLDSLKSGTGLRDSLKDMVAYFEEKYGPEAGMAGLDGVAGAALAGNGTTAVTPKGALLDISA